MISYGENAVLALNTINRQPTKGIPTGGCHIMEHSSIEHLANVTPGSYINDPHTVYISMMKNIGVCINDQYLAENPLTMEVNGYEDKTGGVNEGGIAAELDGIKILEADDVAQHMEEIHIYCFPCPVHGYPEHLLRTFCHVLKVLATTG